MKSLIVYFSRAGENYVNGAMKELEVVRKDVPTVGGGVG